MNLQKQYIKQAIEALHFINYTEVQEKVIPLFLSHKSIVVEAKTGSGKTHAYLIPIFENLDESQNVVQALICAPTRDLANQIFDFAKQIASFSDKPIDIRLFVGGRDRDQEMTRLTKSQPQIVIGTPGRLFDLIRKENLLKAHTNKVLVIDEADMALEDNFLEEIDGIASTMKEKTQMVVLSATIPQSLQPFLKKYLEAPVVIQVQKEEISNLNIKHYFVKTRERDRLDILDQILSAINPYFCIVFCNTKDSADVVHEHINTLGKKVALLHGGIEYRKRKQILSRIKALDFQFLVATDIMSRGIDIDGVSHIVNYELPKDTSFYIHRTGRTGRMSY
ncbi:MAG: DEAD/DEAH box helicase, partial [Candidatus Izemoplasmatales bacterium]|nr:DEAD/DEAH box helicase [Candidatus Izemoplasmatales bacterium]